MPDQYITVITALASSFLGSSIVLLASFLTNRANLARQTMQFQHEVDQKRITLLHERGEELYELIDKWLVGFSIHYLHMSAVMQGNLTYKEYCELIIKESEPINFGRIEMLVYVYFPSIRSAYDKLMKCREEVVAIEIKYEHARDRGDLDGSVFLSSYVQSQISTERAGEILKDKITKRIRAI